MRGLRAHRVEARSDGSLRASGRVMLTVRAAADTVRRVSEQSDRDAQTAAVLDLRGIACPLAWAKAKVHLETLARGVVVDLVIDDPRSLRDLPRAAEASGHHVVDVGEAGPPWRVRLEV